MYWESRAIWNVCCWKGIIYKYLILSFWAQSKWTQKYTFEFADLIKFSIEAPLRLLLHYKWVQAQWPKVKYYANNVWKSLLTEYRPWPYYKSVWLQHWKETLLVFNALTLQWRAWICDTPAALLFCPYYTSQGWSVSRIYRSTSDRLMKYELYCSWYPVCRLSGCGSLQPAAVLNPSPGPLCYK